LLGKDLILGINKYSDLKFDEFSNLKLTIEPDSTNQPISLSNNSQSNT